jgi:hypothetical protein
VLPLEESPRIFTTAQNEDAIERLADWLMRNPRMAALAKEAIEVERTASTGARYGRR